jgi:hypothetical protein
VGVLRPWEQHERYIQSILGLEGTICSGNKFYDPGDAVDHDRESAFPIIADCKFTERKSFSVTRQVLEQWEEKAAEMGKRFIMPVRLCAKGTTPHDSVVMGLHDFAELLTLARRT